MQKTGYHWHKVEKYCMIQVESKLNVAEKLLLQNTAEKNLMHALLFEVEKKLGIARHKYQQDVTDLGATFGC